MDIRKLSLQLNGFPIQKATNDLNKIQGFNIEQILDFQSEMKWKIAKFHFERNPFYKEKVGTIFPTNWDDLPILYKSDFQTSLKSIISKNYRLYSLYISNTSGSGGHPFTFAKDKYCHARTWSYTFNRYHELGINGESKEARFYGIPLEFFPQKKEQLKDILLKRKRFPVFDLSEENLNNYFKNLMSGRFDYIYGYTNSIYEFSKFLLKNNYDLKKSCPGIKLIIVTSELCLDYQREIIEKATGLNVISEYGASEFGYIGKEISKNLWEIVWQNIFVEQTEVSLLEEGGDLLVTDFFNLAFPFIKYSIGDIGTIKTINGKSCITNLLGRTNDMALLPSGKKAPGLTFYYISRSVLENSGVLKEFIVRQTAIDEFWIDYKSDVAIDLNSMDLIRKKFAEYLEPNLNVKFQHLAEIPRTKKGKLKHFYSEITDVI